MPRSPDTKAKILEIAEKEFAEAGFAGAHLQKIAEQVGVRKTALYHYFDSKSELYTAVVESILLEFDRVVAGAIDSNAPPDERLDRLAGDLNDLLAERSNYARLLLRVFVDLPEMDMDRLSPTIERVIGRVLRFHREGVEAGAFHKASARHIFQSVFGLSIFHYAAAQFSATLLGVEDIFTHPAVVWRRQEVTTLLNRGLSKQRT